ncbi:MULTISPECIES: hypothetical protein [Rhodobacterales]|uniref:hypothetical protein n=1 Tax=Rhodobacterales TaxID=204455 RepID=UPI00237EFE9E|nr:hypothetical protein [Phaeobacter gallaeciensis]MDE4140458.1 hypothetical protein [Phaeobacter gallaeciensis]MDE4148849.1 hypothetical protein [Phaeobacter gallaeciensis]MDE4153071.1 hypothetical protein [Phaeobacter gallaeciensis]MDE4228515.1 hypothetical protein [Phaeobacter gallaeciensis]MDE4257591.1 hypothetical protein [Phaeobacter gallaeciensis]
MKIRVSQFIEFAYGDKRKDKAKARSIIDDLDLPYDPAKDRYKQFREAMTSFEEGRMSADKFLELHSSVSANKAAGYKVLCRNYLDLKEDHALTWQGRSPIEVEISGLRITTVWYLRTEANNQRRIIFLHFGKEQMPRKKEKGLLTLLRLAKPESAGVGILNIQPGTLITATRLDQNEANYLQERAAKFVALANDIQSGG